MRFILLTVFSFITFISSFVEKANANSPADAIEGSYQGTMKLVKLAPKVYKPGLRLSCGLSKTSFDSTLTIQKLSARKILIIDDGLAISAKLNKRRFVSKDFMLKGKICRVAVVKRKFDSLKLIMKITDEVLPEQAYCHFTLRGVLSRL